MVDSMARSATSLTSLTRGCLCSITKRSKIFLWHVPIKHGCQATIDCLVPWRFEELSRPCQQIITGSRKFLEWLFPYNLWEATNQQMRALTCFRWSNQPINSHASFMLVMLCNHFYSLHLSPSLCLCDMPLTILVLILSFFLARALLNIRHHNQSYSCSLVLRLKAWRSKALKMNELVRVFVPKHCICMLHSSTCVLQSVLRCTPSSVTLMYFHTHIHSLTACWPRSVLFVLVCLLTLFLHSSSLWTDVWIVFCGPSLHMLFIFLNPT